MNCIFQVKPKLQENAFHFLGLKTYIDVKSSVILWSKCKPPLDFLPLHIHVDPSYDLNIDNYHKTLYNCIYMADHKNKIKYGSCTS